MPLKWLVLGDGLAGALGVSSKAAWLDRARQAGLPVPEGWIVLAGAAGPFDLPATEGLWAVRSAFAAEDGAQESLAGFFASALRVAAQDVNQAIERVRASAARRAGSFRRDVLICRMVDARHAGVAFTQRDFEDDLVNYTLGTGERLVSGEIPGEACELPKRHRGERGSALTAFAPRLQALLRRVRELFGEGDWDVEWADDGRVCWLLQVRPITRPPHRNEAFTLANHKEILPDLPSRYMTSIIAACAPGLFDYYRRIDPSLPARRAFIEVFAGRPLINLSLMADMMRHWGLPTRLVTDNIGGEHGRTEPLRWGRLLRHWRVLARLARTQMAAVGSARQAIERMDAPAAGATFAACGARLRSAYRELVEGMFSLTAAMSGPLSILRRLGVLEQHQARQRTVSTQVYAELAQLCPCDSSFDVAFRSWIERHGHRGVYESDVASPRFRERQDELRATLDCLPPRVRPLPRRTLLGWLTLPLWWWAARPMQAREWFRHEAMRRFDAIRRDLLALASAANVAPEHLWMLTAEETVRLDAGWRPDDAFLAQRRAEIAQDAAVRLPDLIHRHDDLEAYRNEPVRQPVDQLNGICLASGEIRGQAWVLQEPSLQLPAGFHPRHTILVARSVDAGWIPTFRLVSGVVVETGGDLSHGSIILREVGLPSITNVREVTRHFQTGDPVHLRAAAGVIAKMPN